MGFTGVKQLKNNMVCLLDKQVYYLELKGGRSWMKIKTSFEALPEYFAYDNATDNL